MCVTLKASEGSGCRFTTVVEGKSSKVELLDHSTRSTRSVSTETRTEPTVIIGELEAVQVPNCPNWIIASQRKHDATLTAAAIVF